MNPWIGKFILEQLASSDLDEYRLQNFVVTYFQQLAGHAAMTHLPPNTVYTAVKWKTVTT
jgi:hypothetical protein